MISEYIMFNCSFWFNRNLSFEDYSWNVDIRYHQRKGKYTCNSLFKKVTIKIFSILRTVQHLNFIFFIPQSTSLNLALLPFYKRKIWDSDALTSPIYVADNMWQNWQLDSDFFLAQKSILYSYVQHVVNFKHTVI